MLYTPAGAASEVLVHQIQPGLPLLVAGIAAEPASGTAAAEPLLQQLSGMLGLDEDFSVFYAMTDDDQGLSWARGRDAARCLRSPTVFEDLVKCLLRSRAAASQLRPLALGLCRHLGVRTNLGRPAFPSAAAMAAAPSRLYERELKSGALGRPLRELAAYCASGSFYPESLRRAPRSMSELITDEGRFSDLLEEEIEWQFRVEQLLGRLPGYGPRARDLMLPLLGCHDLLALDMATLRAWQRRFSSARSKKPLRHRDLACQRLIRAMQRRVAPYCLYGGLAQRLLLAGEGVREEE